MPAGTTTQLEAEYEPERIEDTHDAQHTCLSHGSTCLCGPSPSR